MKLTVYTDDLRENELRSLFEGSLPFKDRITRYEFFKSYDDFLEHLSENSCDIAIVARPGADGMESARAVKILKPATPLVWFSDDNGFGPESYRVGCTYFSSVPLSRPILEAALERCINEKDL